MLRAIKARVIFPVKESLGKMIASAGENSVVMTLR